jgi:hypothetical protein
MDEEEVHHRMRRVFYHLDSPYPDEDYSLYGLSEWAATSGLAEWSHEVVGLSIGRMGVLGEEPRVDLTIILPSPKVGDFVWTWNCDCLVPDRTLSLFKEADFTGFQVRPVHVGKIKGLGRKRRAEATGPTLWELVIKGKGGDAAQESGIRVIGRNDSGALRYSSFRNGIVVDQANWDGSDFFTINGYPHHLLVTERVKELIIARQLTNCALLPSHELKWGLSTRPEEFFQELRARTARDLSSLLADLESKDKSKWMDTMNALGEKGDPLAIEPLVRKFSHPDPSIWHSAASALAKIARGKDLSERVRENIFSKVISLLGDRKARVRKTAATSLGYIGGDRAAEEVMKLFDDPEESVRSTALFVIEFLRYKPALKAVKRLTRDPSKSVRQRARRLVKELSSDLY